jgi:predicted  nucleic acid-binding Zn-ribbon protein
LTAEAIARAQAKDVNTRLGGLESRMESLEKSQADIHSDTREARDGVREIMITLREQNALERVAEAKTEGRQLVAALREDVVAANTPLRSDIKALRTDVDSLLALRTKGQGVVMGGKWIVDGLKVIAAAGGGAIILKLLEVWK